MNLKCCIGLHKWILFDYSGYSAIYYCENCEKTKTKKLKDKL